VARLPLSREEDAAAALGQDAAFKMPGFLASYGIILPYFALTLNGDLP